jgi:tetratricopeptide (TPR) repeat protein
MTHKTIYSGHLEFGTARSFERMLSMLEHRRENHYRNITVLKPEEIFDMEKGTLDIPRHIAQATNKEWRNTVDMLEFIVQYAIAGDMSAWMVENGKVIKHFHIEPNSDKTAIKAFLQGRELVEETGKEEEAKRVLSKAIDKFERHAKAYERRGYVNFMLKNYDDAMYDYTKSIKINPHSADSRMGRALLKIKMGDHAGAIPDLDIAIKNSLPLQPMFWQARRIKGECHLKVKEFEDAAFELKFVTKRKFNSDDPNYKWRKLAYTNYGLALMELDEYKDALDCFEQALQIKDSKINVAEAELLLYWGLALQKEGRSGFKKAWKDAAACGSERAAELLAKAS